MKRKIIALLALGLTISCSSTKTLKFTQKENKVIKAASLKEFLKSNKNPKVVLRVKNTSKSVTDNDSNTYLFNAIENQLLESGFVVRDRQLFNQIVANEDNNIDYSKIKTKSDTDLIIELTKLDSKILYETNKFYNKNDEEKVEKSYTYKRYGAAVEFKIVLIESNEFAGVYKFNYTPCVKGCSIEKSLKDLKKELKKMKKENDKGFEGVERDELEVFIKDATKKLVSEMRK